MKPIRAGLVVVALTLTLPITSAQSMSHDEEVVRNTYAKLSFLCAVSPLEQIALNQEQYAKVDQVTLTNKVAAAVPTFELSDFQSGSIATIANKPWMDYVSQPSGQVLHGNWSSHSDFSTPPPQHPDGVKWSRSTDSTNSVQTYTITVNWANESLTPDQEAYVSSYSVAKAIEIGTPQWSAVPITLTRYVAFTVNATFDGKSTGSHKAIFLFGTDNSGKEVVVPNDLISGPQPIWDVLIKPAYPVGLLRTESRDVPVVANWIRANTMPASSCSSSKQDVCCSQGRCGLAPADVSRDLSTPHAE